MEKALFFTYEKALLVAQSTKADTYKVHRVSRANQVLGYAVKLVKSGIEIDLTEGMLQ